MAVTTGPRMGATRWSASTDPLTRAQMDASHEGIENTAAGFLRDTLANRPAAGAANSGFLFEDTGTGDLYWSTGAAWLGPFLPRTLLDVKGDLLVGSGADAVGRLAPGADGQVLTADAAEALGVKWAAAAAAGQPSPGLTGLTLPTLDNITWVPKVVKLAAGDNTIYTCPAGKVALLTGIENQYTPYLVFFNPTAGAITVGSYMVPSSGTKGDSNRVYGDTSIAANNQSNLAIQGTGALAAGDSLVINASAAGIYLRCGIVELPTGTNPTFRNARAAIGTADTLLYTVPAATTTFFGSTAQMRIYNPTAGSVNVDILHVPSGQAVAAEHVVQRPNVGAGGFLSSSFAHATPLAAGDKIYVKAAAAGTYVVGAPIVEYV
jgi:hypothetical protein